MQAHDADDKTGDRADPAHEGQQEAVAGALDDGGEQLSPSSAQNMLVFQLILYRL